MADQTTQMDIQARKAKNAGYLFRFCSTRGVEKVAKDLNFDFSGVDAAKSENDLYGLRYSEFVVPLVKAVQELSKENNDLKSRLEKLEALMNTKPSTATHQQSANGNQVVKISSTTGALEQNIRIHLTDTTTINYTLPQQFSTAKMIINDNSGKSMKEIKVSGTGKNNLSMDASSLASGTYHYSLIVDGKLIATKQMVLTK